MNTKMIFNIDQKVKKAAQKKAGSQGVPLIAVLNFATRAYVRGELDVDIVARDIEEARHGKKISANVARHQLGL